MWATDYPHPDSTWPRSQEILTDALQGPAPRRDRDDRLRQRHPPLQPLDARVVGPRDTRGPTNVLRCRWWRTQQQRFRRSSLDEPTLLAAARGSGSGVARAGADGRRPAPDPAVDDRRRVGNRLPLGVPHPTLRRAGPRPLGARQRCPDPRARLRVHRVDHGLPRAAHLDVRQGEPRAPTGAPRRRAPGVASRCPREARRRGARPRRLQGDSRGPSGTRASCTPSGSTARR